MAPHGWERGVLRVCGKKFLCAGVALTALAAVGNATAADLPVNAPLPAPINWSWQGFYGGLESGAAWGITHFSDPFGPSIFGDNVRTPGYFLGADIGFNWQRGSWVYGIEANGNWLASEGTNTCAAFSGFYVSSNCRARPNAFGSLTARVGHTFGPNRTLLYVKGGFAWIHTDLTSTTNDLFDIFGQPPSHQVSAIAGGATVGVGVERAVTPAWSVKFEYDYMNFQNLGNIAISPSVFFNPFTGFLAAIPSANSGVKENLQIFKVGLNRHFDYGEQARWREPAPSLSRYPLKAAPVMPDWEFELGARYWGSTGRFQKDLPAGPLNDQSLVSRLTYADLTGNSGEVFGRVDSPVGVFAKGFVGGGNLTSNGHMNDEDWGIFGAVAYSNTISQPITGPLSYATFDAGFDALRAPDYKIGWFIGYNYFHSKMNAYGCVQIANPASDCIPPVPSSILGIVEDDTWQSLRIGTSAETILIDRLKINGEVAFLPYVKFTGTDDHLLREPPLRFFEDGHGLGVQAEVILSYMFTNQFSVGAGWRYWAMWTTSATDQVLGVVSQRNDTYRVERSGLLLQASYKFEPPAAVVPAAVIAKY
jgi:opacity protein-like surface antigen